MTNVGGPSSSNVLYYHSSSILLSASDASTKQVSMTQTPTIKSDGKEWNAINSTIMVTL